MKKLLVVVDYQNDFVTGALGNPAAELLATGIQTRVEETLQNGGYVLFTRDTHPEDYSQTREGKFLPVPHCIQGTTGWQLYGALHAYETQSPENVAFIDKETFGSAGLPQAVTNLCGIPDAVELCGVVTDICVISNAIILHSFFLEADIAVNANLCAAGTPEAHKRALEVLAGMGYHIL